MWLVSHPSPGLEGVGMRDQLTYGELTRFCERSFPRAAGRGQYKPEADPSWVLQTLGHPDLADPSLPSGMSPVIALRGLPGRRTPSLASTHHWRSKRVNGGGQMSEWGSLPQASLLPHPRLWSGTLPPGTPPSNPPRSAVTRERAVLRALSQDLLSRPPAGLWPRQVILMQSQPRQQAYPTSPQGHGVAGPEEGARPPAALLNLHFLQR